MTQNAYGAARSLVIAAAMFSGGLLPATALAGPDDLGISHAEPRVVLERAGALMTSGKLIQAKAMLVELSQASAQLSMSREESDRLFQLLTQVERRLQAADPIDVNLQKAEHAMTTEDLVSAERYARLVQRAPQATDEQAASAQTVLTLVEGQRRAMAPTMAGLADGALKAFDSGDYPTAKAALERVTRVGADIGVDRQVKVDRTLSRILDLELATGKSFETDRVDLGALEVEPGNGSDWLIASQPTGDDQPPADVTPVDAGDQQGDQASQQDPNVDLIEVNVAQPDLQEAARDYQAHTLLQEANQAFETSHFNDAASKYQTLLAQYRTYLSADELSTAQSRLNQANAELNRRAGDQPITDVVTDLDLARQRTEAQYANQIEQARKALGSGDTAGARNLAAQAQYTVNQGASLLTESTIEAHNNEIANLRAQIDQREEQIRIEEQKRRGDEIAKATLDDQRRQQDQRDQEIVELLERVRQLQLELKYEEALEVIKQILFLDPTNPAGLLLRDVIQDTIIYRRFMTTQREKNLGYAKEALDNNDAMIIPERIVAYPDDWPSISFRRGEPHQFAESAANRAALASIEEKNTQITFEDNPLIDVLNFIESIAGVNMDVDWTSLEDIGIDRETPVTLRLNNVAIKTALDKVLAKVSDPDLPAGWAVEDGIVTIASDEVLRRNVSLEIYDIRDLLIEIPDYSDAPEFDLQSVLQNSSGGGGGGGQSPFSGQTQDREIRPREERVQEIVDIVQATIDPDGWTDLGGDTSSIQELNGNLVITTTPNIHRQINGLLGKLRQVRSLQINVETRFLLVNQDFFEQIGFDLDVVWNAQSNTTKFARTIDPGLYPSDLFDPETGRLKRFAGSGLFDLDGDGTIEGVTPGGDLVPIFGPDLLGDEWSPVNTAQNSLGITNALAASNAFASNILGMGPALSVAGTFLDDIQVDFLVQATQADQRSVTLTAPRLTFTNGQFANVVVATQTAFVSGLTPVVSDSAAAFDPQIGVISEGVRLLIDGVVSSDRRYVTLNVDAQIAELVDFQEQSVTAIAGGQLVMSEEVGQVVQLPIVTVTAVQTTATVPDQGTILLGGQRIVNELEVESGVPVLSKIPILNRFFSNRVDVRQEQTLLILLKPTILIQNEEEERNFPGLLDSLPY
ncbi:MAG: hypothetical protein R3B57_01860 [Phycisphaerales bacterium]